ncbi:hypothetical protein AB0B94_30820 [Micromonospora sp. NPDC048986]|uniref:hypothetical protein n=1 Tax=Micromonospora sp. NPDC048986 TaxID=3155644 RepID=UPI0033EE5B48
MATKRAERSANRRGAWHQAQVNDAPTPRQRLWRACAWLVSEAWRANRLDDAIEAVMNAIDEIREEVRA